MAVQDDIRQASDRFYAALNRLINGDAAPILATISQGPDVSMMHPLGGRQVGRAEVAASLEQVARAVSDGQVALEDLVVIPLGAEAAYTLGNERATARVAGEPVSFTARATNVYRREADGWRLVHHHVDLVPEVAVIATRLQAQAGQ